MKLRIFLPTAVIAALLLSANALLADKGGKKGGGQSEPMWIAGAVQLHDLLGDAIASDGGGAYIDGINGTECVHDQPNAVFECVTGATRSVRLSLGTCISGICADPFNGAGSGFASGETRFLKSSFGGYEGGWPGINETMTSEGGGEIHFGFFVGVERYWAKWTGPNGYIAASGFDDDNDGFLDRVVVNAQPSAVVMLSKLVEKPGKGKKTYLAFEEIGRFTDMPFTATFYSFDYLRSPPRDFPYTR